MTSPISLMELTGLRVLGTRHSAKKIRTLVAERLEDDGAAVIDFSAVTLTQSFADELLGPLLLAHGPALLKKLSFKSCSEDARAIITFVVGQRLRDFHEHNPPGRHRADGNLSIA